MCRYLVMLILTHLLPIATNAQQAVTKSKENLSFILRAHNSACYKPQISKPLPATASRIAPVTTGTHPHASTPAAPTHAIALESNSPPIIKPIAKKISVLAPYITHLSTQKLIAQYCTEWGSFRIFENHDQSISASVSPTLVISKLEQTVISIDREKIQEWDIQTKKLLHETTTSCDKYSVSSDGAYVACTAGLCGPDKIGGLSVISLTDHAINKFIKKNIYLLAVAVSSQCKKIAGSLYDKIWLINTENNGFTVLDTKGYYAKKIIFSALGNYIAAILSSHGSTSRKSCVRVWDNDKPIELSHEKLHGCKIAFTPDEKKLILITINIFILDIATKQVTEFTFGYTTPIQNISFSNAYQVSCTDREVVITDHALKPIQIIPAKDLIKCAVFSHTGKYLAIGTDKKITLWKNKAFELLSPTDDQWED